MKSPTARVPSSPPTSRVQRFSRIARATSRSMRASSSGWPRWARSIPTLKMAASGFARSLPASGGAEPCTGSNIAIPPGRAGWRFALAAIPSPP